MRFEPSRSTPITLPGFATVLLGLGSAFVGIVGLADSYHWHHIDGELVGGAAIVGGVFFIARGGNISRATQVLVALLVVAAGLAYLAGGLMYPTWAEVAQTLVPIGLGLTSLGVAIFYLALRMSN